ncbi:MAG: YgjP-like metallopeptidase domain-containing protein, partial [Lapillicoccus sp.]
YVLDYVLLHELAHLLRPAHDGEFWELLRAYPRVERARGYLEGVAAVAGLGAAWQDDTADGEAGRLVDLLQAAPEPTTLF